jgi:hypothetical protein
MISLSAFQSRLSQLSPTRFFFRDNDRLFTGVFGDSYAFRDEKSYLLYREHLAKTFRVFVLWLLLLLFLIGAEAFVAMLMVVIVSVNYMERANITPNAVAIPGEIALFLQAVRRLVPGCTVATDIPDNSSGESFFEISSGSTTVLVSYGPSVGFGLFKDDQTGFGEHPAIIIRRHVEVAKAVAEKVNV